MKVPSGIDTNNTHVFHFLGLTFGDRLQPNVMTAMFALVVVVILCYVVANLRRSTTGRQMLAMRSNERAAAAAGVNVSGTKLLAFGVSAFIAGIGGGVLAYQSAGVTAAPFAYTASLVFFAFAYLGGITCVSGALWGGLLVQGGLLFTFLQDKFGIPAEMTLVLGGLGLVLTAVLNPEGIAGGLRLLSQRITTAIRARLATGRTEADTGHRDRAEPRDGVMELLHTDAMCVTFGGLRAVDNVDFTVEEGKIIGLIGPNGAGKTTFIDGITGFVPTSGSIKFLGKEISGVPAHKRSRMGLGRTWQSLELFEDLNIAENLQVAAEDQSVLGFLADLVLPQRHRSEKDVDFALDVLGLHDLAKRMPTEISQGQRKLVSAARALAARPQLLCMDEPAAGLDTNESQELGGRMRDIVDAGITIFLVDHDMGLVLNVCDYIYVIEFGATIAQGTPDEVEARPACHRGVPRLLRGST